MNDSGFSDLIRDRRAQLVKEACIAARQENCLSWPCKYQLELSEEEARQLWQTSRAKSTQTANWMR